MHRLPSGWQGQYFAQLDSTQNTAREAARSGAPDGSVFVADYQRAGHGRNGRMWLAPSGSALLVSIVFRRDRVPPPMRFTRLCSLAVAEAIEHQLPGLSAAIKWPNDVLLGDRKVAGILAETYSDGQTLVAIVGIGVNVYSSPSEVGTATCLREWTDAPLERGGLLIAMLQYIDALRVLTDDELHQRWEARLWRRGQRLRLLDNDTEEEVVVLGAAPDGSLRVRTNDGLERRTTTGELLA